MNEILRQPMFLVISKFPTMQKAFNRLLSDRGFQDILTFQSIEVARLELEGVQFVKDVVWILAFPAENRVPPANLHEIFRLSC